MIQNKLIETVSADNLDCKQTAVKVIEVNKSADFDLQNLNKQLITQNELIE